MPHAARVSGFEENLDHPVVDDDGDNEEKEEDDNDGDEVPDAAGGVAARVSGFGENLDQPVVIQA